MLAMRSTLALVLATRGAAEQANATGSGPHSSLRGAAPAGEGTATGSDTQDLLRGAASGSAAAYYGHDHLNCYTGHGGSPLGANDGKQDGVSSVYDCGLACDSQNCACFVFFQDKHECFLRSWCDLSQCEYGQPGGESWDFYTYTPGPEGSYGEYPHLNCYNGHGGTSVWPNDGKQDNVHDVHGCQTACDTESACSCFVFFTEYNECFLRSECEPEQCERGTPDHEDYLFNTYIALSKKPRAQGAAEEVTATGSDTQSFLRGAASGSAAAYYVHDHLNCYTGHGGYPLGPNDGKQDGVSDPSRCAAACDDQNCACFVFFSEKNECFLRSWCELSQCEVGQPGGESYLFDTYTPGSSYVEYQHLNCYSGHGGTSVGPNDGKQDDRHDIAGCQTACNMDSACNCFVFFTEYNECFLRSECEPEQCERGTPDHEDYLFNTYIAETRKV